ncbi:SDR family NAD(P)-dependent oxidoreductase [Dyadobacter fermentans]|uniref:Short-chain dehydrogenase/reductase SDR n=1 Tax=Dyadobacter fermentans (strain ATCC 700827 / DSM 18053 / CIP 107007 / KCTC 52180 / NS114) TaxID=471854 RepID=C6VX67_DYAFD|nr:SDR family oxidoreductase [Dyadobacter fermentans]ACT91540.1 short-chain dehydrogenase/reductase SDR [Dyadobacter fermentans DSM 18053]
MPTYQNKTVIVTGAGNGIGSVVAAHYARQGAAVALWDRDADGLRTVQESLEKEGFKVISRVIDLTNPDEIVTGFEQDGGTLGRIDVLINNAGLGHTQSPYELAVDDWDYVLNTNLRGTFLCAREAAKVMRTQGRGAIVNIASTRALMSEPNTEAYAASKGGILALTHALAISLGPDHITVNAISPGWIETGDYSQLKTTDHAQHPAGRVGKPDDIARACLYLTNPENDFMTGTNLVIDGGMTRKMIYEE